MNAVATAGCEYLPPRQSAVLQFIRDHWRQTGTAPTVREIGRRMEIASPNGVMCHLHALADKGLITIEPFISRGIRLADADHRCPACGREYEDAQPHGRSADQAERPGPTMGNERRPGLCDQSACDLPERESKR